MKLLWWNMFPSMKFNLRTSSSPASQFLLNDILQWSASMPDIATVLRIESALASRPYIA